MATAERYWKTVCVGLARWDGSANYSDLPRTSQRRVRRKGFCLKGENLIPPEPSGPKGLLEILGFRGCLPAIWQAGENPAGDLFLRDRVGPIPGIPRGFAALEDV